VSSLPKRRFEPWLFFCCGTKRVINRTWSCSFVLHERVNIYTNNLKIKNIIMLRRISIAGLEGGSVKAQFSGLTNMGRFWIILDRAATLLNESCLLGRTTTSLNRSCLLARVITLLNGPCLPGRQDPSLPHRLWSRESAKNARGKTSSCLTPHHIPRRPSFLPLIATSSSDVSRRNPRCIASCIRP
jgi:hypothetical protein